MGCISRSQSGSSQKPEETEEQQRGYAPHQQSEPRVDNVELDPEKCNAVHKNRNPFLNFLVIYRQKHTGWPATKVAVEGARVWATMNADQKEKFKRLGRASTVKKKAMIKVEKQYGRRSRMRRRTRHSRKRMKTHERRMKSYERRKSHHRRGRRRQIQRSTRRRRRSSSSRSRSRSRRRRPHSGRHRSRGASRRRRRTRSRRRREPRSKTHRRKSRRRRR